MGEMGQQAPRSSTINDTAQRFGVSVRTLRFYEEAGLITSQRDRSNHRCFDAIALARLSLIVQLRRAGISIADISKVLQIQGQSPNEGRHVDYALQLLGSRLMTLQDLKTATDLAINELLKQHCCAPPACASINVHAVRK